MISRLNPRERRLLFLAAVVLLPLLLFRLVIFPLTDWKNKMQSRAKTLESRIVQVHQLGSQYQAQARTNSRSPEGLGARLSRVFKKLGIIERASLVSQNRPGAAQSLLVQLDGLTLTEMAQAIYQIEHLRPQVIIDNLDLQRSFQNDKRLKLSLVVSGR